MIGRLLLHCSYSLGRPVTIGTPMVIFAVLTVFWLFLVHCWVLIHCCYSLGRPVTIGTPMVFKRQSKQQKSPLVYQSSHDYTESAEYTKPRKRCYLTKPPSHEPGQWPQPVARGQVWLYVSTWTSMCLAPVSCRVLLHSLLPTDDACSSSSLSTPVIKFSIFSDPTRKLSALPPELRRIR